MTPDAPDVEPPHHGGPVSPQDTHEHTDEDLTLPPSDRPTAPASGLPAPTFEALLGELHWHIRQAAKHRAQAETFRQLTHEALALLDETDPDHERVSLRGWLTAARFALGRGQRQP